MLSVSEFSKKYFSNLKTALDAINTESLEQIVEAMESTVKKKSRIYVMGNGGSSATASHMANDFGIGLKRRNVIDFNIISIGDNSAVCTAIGNDIGYENIFSAQLDRILNEDDLIIAISCSGNSPNIVKAVEYAKEVGSTVIGATGFEGGKLRELSDIVFHVDAEQGDYGLVEDVHMILDHVIYSYYIARGN